MNKLDPNKYPQLWQVTYYPTYLYGGRCSAKPTGFYNVDIKDENALRVFFESFDGDEGDDVDRIS